jgi:hypothetical protein
MILRPQIMISFELTVDEIATTDETTPVTSIRMHDTRNHVKINTHQKDKKKLMSLRIILFSIYNK